MQQQKNKEKTIIVLISQAGLGGYIKYAPGTYGAGVGAIVGYLLLKQSWLLALSCTLILLVMGIYVSSKAEEILGEKDPSSVVIDEVVGQLIALLFIPHLTILRMILAFVLFRIFDILKPWPIKKVEKSFNKGIGIMADDVVAGMIAGIGCFFLLILIQ